MGIILVNGQYKSVPANAGEIYVDGSTPYVVMADAGFSTPQANTSPASSAPITTANVVSASNIGFDPDFYKAQNPDVAAAGVDPYTHFRTVGWKEGRDPNPYFDVKGYLATYTDVAAGGSNPLDHYNNFGWKEGRDPSAWFDTSSYLDANPDVKAAGVNPLQHFLASGQFEGRQAIAQVVADTNGGNGNNVVPVGATNGSSTGVTVSWGGWKTTTYSIANDPSGGGFAVNATTGVVTVADASKLTPGSQYSVGVRSTDDGHSVTTLFDIAVQGTPIVPPIITSDGGGSTAVKSVAENGTAVTTVTSTDADGPSATYSIIGGADQSKFTINASSGALSFVTAPNFEAPTDVGTNNTYEVQVQVSDGTNTDTQTITVTVTDVNAAPVFTSGTTGTVAENSTPATVVYDGNATDDGENSNTLTYSFGGGADDGFFSINATTGEVRFQASPNFEARADADGNNVYNIIVRASDGTLTTDRAVAVSVTNVNETPVAADASVVANEDNAYVGWVPAALDPEGANLTYAFVPASNVGGTVTINANGTFVFLPTANFNGNASFQFTASDGTNTSAPKTFTINYLPVNDAPVADPDGAYTIGEDGTLTVNAANGVLDGDTDIDSVGLSANLVSGPAHAASFTLNPDGSFNYTPSANYNGADSFVYRAFDGTAFSAPVVVTINVTAQNDAPVAAAASFSATEDVPYSATLPAATDADGNALTYAVVAGSATNGSVTVNPGGTFTFTPTANFAGNATFQYVANDSTVDSAPVTVTINFGAVNDAPVADPDGAYTIGEDGTLTVNAANGVLDGDTDIDSVGLTASLVSGPAHAASFTLNPDGSFSYAPSVNYNGPDTFTYRAFDGTAFSNPVTVTINVTPQNDAPVAAAASFSATEDVPYSATLPAATDADGNALTYAVVAGSETNGSVTVNPGGTFTFTPTANFAGNATFQYVANDSTVDSAPVTVTINFGAVNDAPVADPDGAYTIGEDGTLTVNAANGVLDGDTDVDSVGLTASLVSGPAHAASFTLNPDGSFSYAPSANYNGPDTFTYRAFDGTAFSNPVTVTINVTPQNDAPVAAAASFSATEDVPYSATLPAATDADGNALTYAVVAGSATNGSVTVNPDGTFTFTPTANFAGNATFQYVANDSTVDSAPVTVTINFGAVNDAPVGNADTFTINEDDAPVAPFFNVLGNDTDVEDAGGIPVKVSRINGTAVAVNGTVGVSGGAVTLNADYTLSFTPTPNFNGDATFTYTAMDGAGAESAPTQVTVQVNSVNDAPTAAPNSFTASEDTPFTINLLANDSDPESGKPNIVAQIDGQNIIVGGNVTVAGGTVHLNGDQTITFTPTANFNGPGLSFTYVARDVLGGQLSNTATVSYSVTAVNDAPVANADNGVFSTNEDNPTTFNVLTNDTDIEDITPTSIGRINGTALTTVGQVVNIGPGTLTWNGGGSLTFTPNLNFNGTASFTYTAKDSGGLESGITTANVTVNPVNDRPVAVDNLDIAVAEDTPTVINVVGNDTDVDGPSPLRVARIDGVVVNSGDIVNVTGGTITVNANGSLTFTPAANLNGNDAGSFNYHVKDNAGLELLVAANVTLDIGAVNDAPAINAPNTSGTPVELLANGSFESGTLPDTFLPAGSTVITGWTTVIGETYYNQTLWQDGAGTRSVNIASALAPAGIETTLTTVIGQTYTVEFEMAGNTFYAFSHTARVSAAAQQQDFTFNSTGRSNADMGWAPYTFTFTATSATTTLRFETISGSPVIDSVSVDDPTANQPLAVTEDTPFAFTGPAAITISDVDAAGGNVTVTLQVGNGTLTAAASGGADVDGGGSDTLTITGTVTDINATLGSLAYAPAGNFNGADALIINVDDGGNTGAGGALSATRTVSLDVAAVNDAPVAVADLGYATAEDSPLVLAVLGNDTDVDGAFPLAVSRIDGNTVSVGQTVNVTGGTVTVNADGTLTFSPTANSTTDGAFTYRVKDGTGLEGNTVNVAVDVTAVNDAPIANADTGSFSVNEDNPITFNVLTNDTDIEDGTPGLIGRVNGAALTVVGQTINIGSGILTWNGGGSLTFTPNVNFNGTASFNYTAKDSGGLESGLAIANITVNPVNDRPIAVDNLDIAVTEDIPTLINVVGNDTDVDGPAPLRVARIDGVVVNSGDVVNVTGGTITVNANGSLTFTPTANVTGNDAGSFNYHVKDNAGLESLVAANVTLDISAVNDAPVNTVPGTQTTNEDTAKTFSIAGGNAISVADLDATSLTVTLTVQHGTLTLAGMAGLTINGGANGSATVTFTGSATDINAAMNGLSYAPAGNYNGGDTLVVTTSDNGGTGTGGTLTDTDTIAISVTAQNDAPVAVADLAYATTEDSPLVLAVLGNDTDVDGAFPLAVSRIDGNTVSVGQTVNVTGGTVTVNADGTLTFSPTADSTTDGAFTYRVKDGTGLEGNTVNVAVDVTAVNDAPVANADNLSATQDGSPAVGNLLANDTDIEDGSPIPGNITSFTVAGAGAGTVNTPLALGNGAFLTVASNGAVTLTQNNAYDGLGTGDTAQISLTYTVTDSGGASANSSAVITVTGVNDPISSPATVSLDVTEDLVTQVNGDVFDDVTDLDIGDNHTVTAVVTGATPGVGGVGAAVGGTYGTLTIDVNGQAHYELNNALPAVQALNTGSTPLTDTFTYTVSDGPTSASTTITFNVHGTNDGPVARPDFATVTEDTATTLNVLTGSDTDVDAGDVLSVVSFNIGGGPIAAGTFVGVGPGGTAQLTVLGTGEVVLTQNGAFEFLRTGETRTISFSYTMRDLAGATDVSSVSLTVTGANDAPTLDLDTATAGDNFATVATSGDLNTAISGNTAISDGLADAEGRIKIIKLELAAVSGVTDTNEGLHLPAGYAAALFNLGIANVTGDGSATLTITAMTSFSPDQAEAIIEAITHANPDTTFNFNPEDRTVTVTVTDQNANANPNATDVQITTIDMAANVVDTTNVNNFIGANRADTIVGDAGSDIMEGRGGNDTIYGGTTTGDLAGEDVAVFSGNVGEYTITRIDFDLLHGAGQHHRARRHRQRA